MGASGDARSSTGRPTLPDEWLQTLKKALQDKGWKARDLAQAIDQTDSSISKLLANQGKVGIPTIRKVQHVLNLPDPFPKPMPVLARGTRERHELPTHEDADGADGLDEPELREWVQCGRRLHAHDPKKLTLFVEALKDFLDHFDAAEAKARRVQDLLTGKFDHF